ncbi:U32 family peptidase [Acutalibacter sp. 1XD8-33]|uniref:peptidase U32 family protein n=1 Tax=Acutalibacter sp. 1XD8-33 TaxID=2320081 RepID=UPI000EA2E98F|nr:U32 family peptidase [Acutalibacter sp. 1XD8-33]RKJ41350.1 U32 family peptidase [Acutalibacter sp. 1XD8-33]
MSAGRNSQGALTLDPSGSHRQSARGDRCKPELLAPAGDMERLEAAVRYGADAVYLAGKDYGMRAAPGNFTREELEKGVELCHQSGVRVYVTCNTLPRNYELQNLPDFLAFCQRAGVDGLIISDLGVLALAKEYAPDVERHVSTQTGIVNYAAAKACHDLGASRVVLAREVPLEEIKEIRRKTPPELELEAFVHGSMCVSFSGRCLLSNYMAGRDANRGQCAQPCRWEYFLTEKQRPGQQFSIIEQGGGTYILNSNDLRMIQHIPAMAKAGISSLKIEGRAKSAYYVACVTAAYRRAIDFFWENPGLPLPQEILEETEKISHRAYSPGFYFGGEPGQTPDRSQYTRNYEVAAVCQGRQGEYVLLRERNRFFRGELVDILQPGKEPFTAELSELYNQDWEPIKAAPHAEMLVYWKTPLDLEKGAYLRIRR